MTLVLLIIGALFILYLLNHGKSKKQEFYKLSDFPMMQEFHDAYGDILKDCVRAMRCKTHPIHRPADVWSNANKEKTDAFLSKHKDICGWIPAWSPGSTLANNKWLNFPLLAVGHRFENNLAMCPALAALINKHESRINICGLSLMKPGGGLDPHEDTTGPEYGSMSYHLGLVIPRDGECDLTVNGKRIIQRPGQSILFDSTFTHSAHNPTNEDRVILYIDFKI